MERALVIYESMFGNTRAIGEAVARGLSEHLATDLIEVSHAPASIPQDVSVVVVGGPTHAFGLSRPRTRQDAASQADEPLDPATGLREWLDDVERPRPHVAGGAFDTRIDKPRVPGSAARAAERRLRKLGFEIAASAESFYVAGTKGPLVDGELQRARRWAAASFATVGGDDARSGVTADRRS
jgi:hypothetical protein